MFRQAFLPTVLAAAVLTGCSGESSISPPPPTPSDIQIVSGNNQTWFAGYALPGPLVVAVKDAEGSGIAGATVDWSVETGSGALSASSSVTNADGQASVNWTLGTGNGSQTVVARARGTALAQTFWTTASIGWPNMALIVHFDGSTWTRSLSSNVPGFIRLTAIWGSSANDIFAAGTACGVPTFFHFNGTTWGTPESCTGGSLYDFTGLWGSSASDIFAGYRNAVPPFASGGVMHYDGQTWTSSYSKGCSFCSPGVNDVWSRSGNDAIAVGDSGKVLHYDGTNWLAEPSATVASLSGVWGSGSDVFSVGGGGTILYNDGSGWRIQSSGTTSGLNAVWGASPTNVFAVGASGTILHYNGASWAAQSSGTTESLRAIWGSSGNAVFAVGDNGTIRFYNGTNWTSQSAGAPINLRGVWGSSPTNVYAVGVPLP
jgi:hypothetical protein